MPLVLFPVGSRRGHVLWCWIRGHRLKKYCWIFTNCSLHLFLSAFYFLSKEMLHVLQDSTQGSTVHLLTSVFDNICFVKKKRVCGSISSRRWASYQPFGLRCWLANAASGKIIHEAERKPEEGWRCLKEVYRKRDSWLKVRKLGTDTELSGAGRSNGNVGKQEKAGLQRWLVQMAELSWARRSNKNNVADEPKANTEWSR